MAKVYIRPTGSDTNGTGGRTDPYLTIGRALTGITGFNDELIFLDGYYLIPEGIEISDKSNLKFRADNPGNVFLDVTADDYAFLFSSCNGLQFSGLAIKAVSSKGFLKLVGCKNMRIDQVSNSPLTITSDKHFNFFYIKNTTGIIANTIISRVNVSGLATTSFVETDNVVDIHIFSGCEFSHVNSVSSIEAVKIGNNALEIMVEGLTVHSLNASQGISTGINEVLGEMTNDVVSDYHNSAEGLYVAYRPPEDRADSSLFRFFSTERVITPIFDTRLDGDFTFDSGFRGLDGDVQIEDQIIPSGITSVEIIFYSETGEQVADAIMVQLQQDVWQMETQLSLGGLGARYYAYKVQYANGEKTITIGKDGGEVVDVQSDAMSAGYETVGVFISTGSKSNITIDKCLFHTIDVGVIVSGHTDISSANDVMRNIFYNLDVAVLTRRGTRCSVFNNNMDDVNWGIQARERSRILFENNIVSNTINAMLASNGSFLRVSYTNLYKNDSNFMVATNGNIYRGTNIRYINPKYKDRANHDLSLQDDSGLIEAGKVQNFVYNGSAPDIGKYDVIRKRTEAEVMGVIQDFNFEEFTFPPLSVASVQEILNDVFVQEGIGSVREGTALNDLMVKPHKMLMDRVLDTTNLLLGSQTILNSHRMGQAELDGLMANIFVERRRGFKNSPVARIYYETPRTISVQAGVKATSINGNNFFSRTTVEITETEMSLNKEDNLFFVDVPLIAEDVGSDYNVDSDQITEISDVFGDYVRITNPEASHGGADTESNEALVIRGKKSIGKRVLNNKPGITGLFYENFPDLRAVTPIGYRDEEMQRDQFLGQHFGGFTDYYVREGDLQEATIDIIDVPETYQLDFANFGNVPLLKILDIEYLEMGSREPIGELLSEDLYEFKVIDNVKRFSAEEKNQLVFDNDVVGKNVRMRFLWAPFVNVMQEFIDSRSARNTCQNGLIFSYVPKFVSVNLNYSGDEGIAENIRASAITFIKNLNPEKTLQASDFVNIAYTEGAVRVQAPFLVTVETHSRDGNVTIEDLENEVGLERTQAFFVLSVNVEHIADGTN